MNLAKILLLLFINISASDFLFSQDYNWITPNKTYLKLYIADDGIHRINKSDFENAGISTSSIDPRTLRVFNRGNQIPVYVRGESDGFFNDSDFVDFYGTRNYGGLTNAYNQDNQIVYSTNERFDLYSDTNVYWIDWGGTNGLRMFNSAYVAPSNYLQNFSNELLHLEKDKIYWIGQATSGNDFGNFTNERYLGESWYWSLLGNGQTVSDTFSVQLLNINSPAVSLRVFAYPQSASFSVTNEHNLQIKVNGNVVADFVRNDFNRVDTTVTFSSALLSETNVNNVSATYTSSGGFSGTMFLDLFEFKYPKVLKFRNNISLMDLAGEDSTSKKIKLSGFNPGNQTFIYDIKNNIRITSFSNSADTLIFSAKQNSKIEIINKVVSKKPFKIIQRQVPDLVSSVNGADYLIIYNKLFESQALQLQNHRETYDNYRVKITDIKDIYDIFNFGIESPDAVRNFNRHIFYNWQQPRVKYICLFGRGSLDPKKNSDATVYRENLIPVKGNPSSDNFYSNVFFNNFIFYNQISIGRLPALTVSEAQNMVNNIITYETQPPQKWWKDFTFIGGGVNQAEQQLFLSLNNDSLINPYILPNPVKGNPVRILRNDLNGAETFNYSDSIKNQINRGTLTVNFMGHAGSQDWEIALNDPEILSNHGKFPVILSMTCYTGKVGEPNFRSFGERFMNMNNTGAVSFFATSGWGFVYSGSLINSLFYKSFAKDTVRRVGDMVSYAMNSIKSDSLSFSIRHTVNCYTLMGDPALKLQLPAYPEFTISENDYKLSNKSPSVNEPINLKVFPQNFGLNSDSATMRLLVTKDFAKYYFKDTVLRNFSSKDSISYNFKLNSKGRYEAKVILDLYNSSPDENKNDNTLIFEIDVKNVSFVPYKPVHNSVVRKDSVEYVGMNPFIKKNEKSIILLLQTDTSANFNSPVSQLFINKEPHGAVSKFKTLLPVKDTSKLYYWRTNSVINGDSSGWSAVQMFKYNPLISISDKTIDSASDTLTTIYKISPQQFQPYELTNTSYNTENSSNGIKIAEFTGKLYVRSLGTNGAEASYFSVMNKSIHMDAGGNSGMNLLKVRKTDGKILQYKNFKMTFPTSSDSILNFLNTFDTTHYLMGLNAAYVAGTFLLNTNVINKFAQFGSTKVSNFRIGFFDSWSFIGYLGAPQSDVSETLNRYISSWIESESSQIKKFKWSYGYSEFSIGPANAWQNFSWNNILLPSNKILFDVYGVKPDGNSDLLLQNISTNSNTDLSAVNAYQYPVLNFMGKYTIDTLTGSKSPVLTSFKVNYRNPAELAAELDDLWKSDSTAVSGKELKVRFKIYNEGDIDLPGYIANVYMLKNSESLFLKSDTLNNSLLKNNSVIHESKFIIPVLRNSSDYITFFVEILPKGNYTEAFTFNNYVYFDLLNAPASSIAGIEVFSDGKKIQDGDNVSLNPELKVSVNTDPDLANSDAVINLKEILINGVSVNDRTVAEKNSKDNNTIVKRAERNLSFSNEMIFHPGLIKGTNTLTVIFGDQNGNSDTASLTLNVSDLYSVGELYNYPNPMKTETNFIFDLTGFENPGNGKIKIYTVSGKMIREIDIPLNFGFNTISWDGKDNDGDLIANGTYLYKLFITGAENLESEVKKLVILK